MATKIDQSKTNAVTTSGAGAIVGADQDEKKDPLPPIPKLKKIPDGSTPDNTESLTNTAVESITERLSKIKTTSEAQNENTTTAIDNFKQALGDKVKAIKEEEDEKKRQEATEKLIEHCNNAIDMTQNILDNIDGLTSGDPVSCINSTLDIIGTAATTFFGPGGAVVGAVCGILSSVISLFGGNDDTKSPGEVMASIVRSALDDFKDDDIDENFQGSLLEGQMSMSILNGIASNNGGKINVIAEGPILASADYARIGISLMGEIQSQLQNHRDDADDKKSGYLAKYLYYYCAIFQLKRVVLTLQCSLLRENGLDSVFKGIHRYLSVGVIDAATECLKFLSEMPNPTRDFKWYKLYRDIHDPTILDQGKREVISRTLHLCGITMPGELVKLSNIAVGDACVAPPTDDKKKNNNRVIPGSYTNYCIGHAPEYYDLDHRKGDFGPICNLFRKFSPKEGLGEGPGTFEEKRYADVDGFCLFSVKYCCYVFVGVTGDHSLWCFNQRGKGESPEMYDYNHGHKNQYVHRDSMVFQLEENDLLKGGATDNGVFKFVPVNWKHAYATAWDVKKAVQHYGTDFDKGSYRAEFRATTHSVPDNNPTFNWNLVPCDYGKYTYNQYPTNIITPNDVTIFEGQDSGKAFKSYD